MDPVYYLKVLKHRRKAMSIPLALGLVFALVSVAGTFFVNAPERYEATVDLVGRGRVSEEAENVGHQIVTSTVVLEDAAEISDVDVSEIENSVEVSSEENGRIFHITATASSAEQAEKIADAVATATVEFVKELGPGEGPLASSDSAAEEIREEMDTLSRTLAQIEQRHARRIAKAKSSFELERLVAELNAATASVNRRLAILKEQYSDALTETEGSEEGAPIFLEKLSGPTSSVKESASVSKRSVLFRIVGGLILGALSGLGLVFLLEILEPRLYLADDAGSTVGAPVLAELPAPASSRPTENGTSPVVLLAAELMSLSAGSGRARRLLFTGTPETNGMAATTGQIAQGFVTLGEKANLVGSDAIDTGAATPERVTDLLTQAEDGASVVLIDSGPLSESPAGVRLATLADGVIVVAREGQTLKKTAEHTGSAIRNLGAPLLGVVFLTDGVL